MATVTPCQAYPADTCPPDTHANCSKVVVHPIVSSHITTVGIIPQVSRPEGVRTPDQCNIQIYLLNSWGVVQKLQPFCWVGTSIAQDQKADKTLIA
jgi:hypothetical protein